MSQEELFGSKFWCVAPGTASRTGAEKVAHGSKEEEGKAEAEP